MYAIAQSVAACLRAGTRVDVAWVVDAAGSPAAADIAPTDAIGITPGGGKLGSMLAGALDGPLTDAAAVHATTGRLVRLDIGPGDAAIAGVAPASGIGCLIVPGTELPADLWEHLVGRAPVCLVSDLDPATGEVTRTTLFTDATIDDAPEPAARLFGRTASATEVAGDMVVTVIWPQPTLVLVRAGEGPAEIIEALGVLAAALGWRVTEANTRGEATGVIAGLSSIDGVVVLGHDLEIGGEALLAALRNPEVGYIGAVGPERLQRARADWLEYRDITDLSRVHGPAGLDIGARNPREVALAVLAEMVAARTAAGG